MRIAFYTPMKPLDHPVPSGDRTMAQHLAAALQLAGHTVEAPCRLSSYDGNGDFVRQQRLARIGERAAAAICDRWHRRRSSERPRLWFTYHLYHKAPDWLGPQITREFGLPYVVAEASHAWKQTEGRWAFNHAGATRALAAADLVVGLNPADAAGTAAVLGGAERMVELKPFIDAHQFSAAAAAREHWRASLARELKLPREIPWLLTVAMMREGAKLASYRLLAAALDGLKTRPWRLLVVGDGPARPAVMAALAPFEDRLVWLGRREGEALPSIYAAADVYAWPAVAEAWGMTLLEAQAAGIPVVVGSTPGVDAVVEDGSSGIVVPNGDAVAFAAALAALLDDRDRRLHMGSEATRRMLAAHDLRTAAHQLGAALARVTRCR